jgi:hypothetical protein
VDLEELARARRRVVTAAELDAVGIDGNSVARLRRNGELVRLFHRTYAVPPVTESPFALACRGAVAYGGRGAVVAGEAALARVAPYPEPLLVDVAVPRERGVRSTPGLRAAAVRPAWLAGAREIDGVPVQDPARAVAFAWSRTPGVADARAIVCAALLARAVTSDEVRAVTAAFPRLRRREDLLATCGYVDAGCESPLEIDYLLDVEQAYGLPAGDRQAPVVVPGGRVRRVDVRYGDVVVELDGRHHAVGPRRDDDAVRDVVLAALGLRVLRFGWREVRESPGLVAATVRSALADDAARRASVS